MGLSNSQDKLYLPSPTLARKLKMETNADFYKCQYWFICLWWKNNNWL